MPEPGFTVWETLENVDVRIYWNENPEFNYLEIHTGGERFKITLTIETSEFLIKRFGDPVLSELIKDCENKKKTPK